MKKILVVSHCILNHAAKVSQDESSLAEEYELRDKLMQLVLENKIQLLQLPCPEFFLYGSRRWGHVKDQFMHPHFKNECKKMLEPIVMQLEEYSTYKEEFDIQGIVSVEGSPSCGYGLTCRGNWGGELEEIEKVKESKDSLEMKKEAGVFMQILEELLNERDLQIPIMSMENAIHILSN